MSTVQIADAGSGHFRVTIDFTTEDCDRLPFNALVRVGADLESNPHGGARAAATFNLRDPSAAGRFVETLAVFGEGGLFAHGTTGRAPESGV